MGLIYRLAAVKSTPAVIHSSVLAVAIPERIGVRTMIDNDFKKEGQLKAVSVPLPTALQELDSVVKDVVSHISDFTKNKSDFTRNRKLNAFNTINDSKLHISINGDVKSFNGKLPLIIVYIAIGLIYLISKIVTRMLNRRPKSQPLTLEACYGAKRGKFFVMEDSGNKVVEPFSGEPVIFITESALKKIISDDVILAMKMEKQIYKNGSKAIFRVIVFNTVSGSDMCACMRFDKLVLNGKEIKAWIALGKNIILDGIDGIVPSELLS